MAQIPRPKLQNVPGGSLTMPSAKEENQIKDLTKLTQLELLDLRERETKLLANKKQMNRLPDKGKRIQEFYEKVLEELNRRANLEDAAAMFSQLNIVSKGENVLNKLEWNGRLNGNEMTEVDPTNDVIDSDDEFTIDPLRIIAKQTMHKRQVRVEPPEPTLITAADLADIESFKATDNGASTDSETTVDIENGETEVDAEIVSIDLNEKLKDIKPKIDRIHKSSASNPDSQLDSSSTSIKEVEQHVRYVVKMTEDAVQPQREKFKPYRTTKSNVHDPAKERDRKLGKHWEVTAATPPPIKHSGTKMLTLLDSVEIQTNYLAKMKELHEKQAAERLAAKEARMEKYKIALPDSAVMKTSPAFTSYRSTTNHIEGKVHEHEADEVHDPLNEEKATGITYTVYE